MNLLDLTPRDRFLQERDLPFIFDDGYHPDRIEWYTRLMLGAVERNIFRPSTDIPEFIAAMICEAGLVNSTFGDSNPAPDGHFGVGWCQLDTGYHVADLPSLLAIRRDPLHSLLYIAATPDLCKHGAEESHFNEQRWNAWKPEIIDPPLDADGNATGWSALKAATGVYKRLVAA